MTSAIDLAEWTLVDWEQRTAALEPRSSAFIDGQFTPAISGETFDDFSPRDGRLLARVAACDSPDVDRAVAAARRAFDHGPWPRMAARERKNILLRFASLIREHRAALALLQTLDVGKPLRDSVRVDVPNAATCISWYAEAIDTLYDDIART